MNTIEVLIVGAGPYGIAVASELHHRRISFAIIGKPFSLWLDHTLDEASLRSDRHASEIYDPMGAYPLSAYIRKVEPQRAESILDGRIPSLIFRKYLIDITRRLPFAVRTTRVNQLISQEDSFLATLDTGEQIRSRRVVVATGVEPHRHLPLGLSKIPPDRVAHAYEVDRYQHLRGKHLLIIGAGQSAGDAAKILSRRNRVTWVRRKKPVFYSEPINLPRPLFKAALKLSPLFYWLPWPMKRALAKRFVETTMTPDLECELRPPKVGILQSSIEDLALRFSGGALRSPLLEDPADFLVAATGYRLSMDHLKFIDSSILGRLRRNQGSLWLDSRFRTSFPGLHVVGGLAEPMHGPAQRFLMGATHAAHQIGKCLESASP